MISSFAHKPYYSVNYSLFPKTEQNIVKSLNCLLTGRGKNSSFKKVDGRLLLRVRSVEAPWDRVCCNSSQLLIIRVISYSLSQKEEKKVEIKRNTAMKSPLV